MNKNTIIIAVLIIGVVSLYGANNYYHGKTVFGSARVPKVQSLPVVDEATQGREYRTRIRAVWQEYSKIKDSPDADAIARVQTEALGVTLPAGDKQAHLDLVLGLTLVEQGVRTHDEATAKKGYARLDNFVKENPWVTSQ